MYHFPSVGLFPGPWLSRCPHLWASVLFVFLWFYFASFPMTLLPRQFVTTIISSYRNTSLWFSYFVPTCPSSSSFSSFNNLNKRPHWSGWRWKLKKKCFEENHRSSSASLVCTNFVSPKGDFWVTRRDKSSMVIWLYRLPVVILFVDIYKFIKEMNSTFNLV